MYSRTEALIGSEKLEKLQNSRVLIAGLGGVGGYILESLVRAGVGTIGLCDFDMVDVSNLNRQILATRETVDMHKTEAAALRAKSINPEIKICQYNFQLTPENLDALQLSSWDFIADAIDDVPAKIALMEAAPDKIISCMGTGNKLNPFGFTIDRIEKTEGDPLARSIRRLLREKGIKNIPVLYSKEAPVSENTRPIPTISYMPAIAGLEIGAYIIKRLIF